MKGKFIQVGIAALVISLPSTVIAARYDSIVTGKSDPGSDIVAVQSAIDKGGSVLLKGTFDFGKDGKVKISKDVNVYGETDAQGIPVTKIQGGFWTFHSTLPEQLPIQSPGPKIGIQSIHFDGAVWSPIFLPYCGGAEITNNKITNVRPVPGTVFGKEGMYRHQGITLVPIFALPKEHQKYQPGAVTGTIMIADNDIDLSTDLPEKTMAQGVLVIGATGANIQILRNRVVNCSRNSLESLDNYPGEDGGGMTIIKGNKIVTANKGIPLPTASTPNGIIAGWFLDLAGANDPARLTKIVVTKNQIEARGESSLGITVLSDGAVVTSNYLNMAGGANSTGIFHGTSDSIISNNKIEGAGSYAINVMGFQKLTPRRNVIMDNDYTAFKASKADVFVGGVNNLVLEENSKVVDQDQANVVLK